MESHPGVPSRANTIISFTVMVIFFLNTALFRHFRLLFWTFGTKPAEAASFSLLNFLPVESLAFYAVFARSWARFFSS